jgi:ribonuclease HI
LPLYRLLKKHERFSWTVEAQEALNKLKTTLAHVLILTPPQNSEPIYLYVTTTTQVVSPVIIVERTEEVHALPVQRPLYYISEVLSETKARYPQIQKLLYAVVLARRKLRHYLEAHPVKVVSLFPLGEIIWDLIVAKWSVELMGETLTYVPRKVIESQILADFVAESTDTQLQADGSVMKTGVGTGLLFISPLGEHMRYVVCLHFPVSNNIAEYETLLCGLRISIETGIKRLDVRGDSQLVIDQVMKNASYHDEKMEAYCNVVCALEDKFYGIELNHIPCKYNEEADELTKIVSGRITVPLNIFSLDVAKPSVDLGPAPSNQEGPSKAPSNLAGAEPMDEDPSNEVFVLSLLKGYGADEAEAMETKPPPHAEDWRAKYLTSIDRGELPSDQSEARRIAWKAKSFTIIDGELYKRAASGVLEWCIPHPPRSRAYSRHPRGCVRPPHGAARPRGQHVPPRLLLAHRGRRHQRGRVHLRGVPILRPQDQFASSCPADHIRHMAIRHVGVRQRRAPTEGARGLHSPVSRHGQILQVDRGMPNHESQGRTGHVLYRHHPPVWSVEFHHHRQWLPIYQQKIPGILR